MNGSPCLSGQPGQEVWEVLLPSLSAPDAQLSPAHASSTHILLRCLRRAEMFLLSLLPCFSSFWARLFSSLCRLWNCCSS